MTLGAICVALIMLSAGFLIGLLVHKDNYIYALEERDLYKSAFTELFNSLSEEDQEKILSESENNDKMDRVV